MRPKRKALAGLTYLALSMGASWHAAAGGRGQGAIVIHDDAPIYVNATGDRLEAKAPRGWSIAGITTFVGKVSSYMAEIDDGRAHVLYLRKNVISAKPLVQDLKDLSRNEKVLKFRAFMNPDDLAYFTYECGCGNHEDPCSPVELAGWMNERWNACFVEARDKKLAELKQQWEKEAGGATAGSDGDAASSRSASKALTNDDVISLVKVGLDDGVITAKIEQAKAVAFDVSADGLAALKKAGASNAVVKAMLKRAEKE